MRRLIIIAVVALLPAAAAAEAPGEMTQLLAKPSLSKAVSLHLPALFVRGLSAQFEHYTFADRKLSLSATGSFRSNASSADYSSYSYGVGAEMRYWFYQRAAWSALPDRTMVGLYLGGRFDIMHTRVKDEVDDRTIGGALTFAESVTFGYRFLISQRFELTPSIEVSIRTETDTSGRLPAWTRGAVGLGLSAGYMF